MAETGNRWPGTNDGGRQCETKMFKMAGQETGGKATMMVVGRVKESCSKRLKQETGGKAPMVVGLGTKCSFLANSAPSDLLVSELT